VRILCLFLYECDVLKNNPGLTISPYRVQSAVSREDFRDFGSALEDRSISINGRYFPGPSQLSKEFGCQAVSAHQQSPRLAEARAAEVWSRISPGQQEPQLAALQSKLFTTLWRASSQSWKHLRRCPSSGGNRGAGFADCFGISAALRRFCAKRFKLLWRDSRDDFVAAARTLSLSYRLDCLKFSLQNCMLLDKLI
jgi:hypothetical protein